MTAHDLVLVIYERTGFIIPRFVARELLKLMREKAKWPKTK